MEESHCKLFSLTIIWFLGFECNVLALAKRENKHIHYLRDYTSLALELCRVNLSLPFPSISSLQILYDLSSSKTSIFGLTIIISWQNSFFLFCSPVKESFPFGFEIIGYNLNEGCYYCQSVVNLCRK